MRRRWVQYSEQERAWLQANCSMSRADLHRAFCERFARADVTVDNIKALCTREAWSTGRTGQFAPGAIPANKGRPCPPGVGGNSPNAQRTQFKKGQRSKNYRGPGYERICSKDGYVILVIAEKNPWSGHATRPVLKHKWLWEKQNGPVPKGFVLKSRDGNKLNTDPANWQLISRATLAVLNRKHNGLDFNAMPVELKASVLAIAQVKAAKGKARVSA